MELFGLVEDRYNKISGVSMVPGTFNAFPCFHLHSDALLAQPTRYSRGCLHKNIAIEHFVVCHPVLSYILVRRYIHPEGLPSDYTITMLFRLLADTPEEPFALWEILNKNNEPLAGVILDSKWRITAVNNHCYINHHPLSRTISQTKYSNAKYLQSCYING